MTQRRAYAIGAGVAATNNDDFLALGANVVAVLELRIEQAFARKFVLAESLFRMLFSYFFKVFLALSTVINYFHGHFFSKCHNESKIFTDILLGFYKG